MVRHLFKLDPVLLCFENRGSDQDDFLGCITLAVQVQYTYTLQLVNSTGAVHLHFTICKQSDAVRL